MSILDKFGLSGKVAVITGAGKGIGAEIARVFAEAGADIVLAARTEEDLNRVARAVAARAAVVGLVDGVRGWLSLVGALAMTEKANLVRSARSHGLVLPARVDPRRAAGRDGEGCAPSRSIHSIPSAR